MMKKIGFDNDKYLKTQSQHILQRIAQFDNKLYLEFGGKLFDDFHAVRVLPGFEPDSKLRMLLELKDQAEIIVAISATDIENSKVRRDIGITYDADVLRLIDEFRNLGLYVGSVVITKYEHQPTADQYKALLENKGVKVFKLNYIPNYPSDLEFVISEEGYGKNDYVETTRPLVVVTAPGPGSGKMSLCLSQLYHEYTKKGIKAGYAKFETFPIWNIPLNHPVNLAYEAATADLDDVNMIDPYHLEAYGKTTVNYNRDVEIFPLLETIFERISGACPYKSPTDMGVNMAGNCIVDDENVRVHAKAEIVRRYFNTLCDEKMGRATAHSVKKCEMLMKQAHTSAAERLVRTAALEKSRITDCPVVAIELPDGQIVTGKTSELLSSTSAALINALKTMANIDDAEHLISPEIIEPIQQLKEGTLGYNSIKLHLAELLIALSIQSTDCDKSAMALKKLNELKCCEAHSTIMLSQDDLSVCKKLGINITCEPVFKNNNLFN